MSVDLKDGKQASEPDVVALEAVIEQPLDFQFRRFVETNDGAYPEDNSFPVGDIAHMGGVDRFIPIESIIRQREYIEDIGPHAYPVALSACGNYVILDQGKEGAIFFWDHEVEGGLTKIADRFDGFLNLLEPFDVASIKLAPGQVKSAWINPDLLKQFGD